MKKDARFFLTHIVESIEFVERYAQPLRSERDFVKSTQAQDAILRRLTIIGEAVKNLPTSLRKEHPDIPWREIAGMRDILIHEYFGVDLELTWGMIKQDLPRLKQYAIQILKSKKLH